MSFNTLEGLFNKGKAKLQEYKDHHPSQDPPPPQGYPGVQYPPQQGYQQPQYNQPPPGYYQNPQQQNHQQPPYSHNNGPSFGNPPPIPYGTRPGAPPIPSARPPALSNSYWQANFNPSIPVSEIFKQETGAHGWGNAESQNYTTASENSFFTPDNKLVIRAIVNTASQTDKYTSARLFTHQLLGRQRGCLTATLSAPCATGIWPAFWLLPAEPFVWPSDGEIDIFESWNGDCVNHSCLHWGHYNGEDWNKHRVLDTPIPSLPHQPHRFDLAWNQGEDGKGGRLVWYIDGTAVMKATIPEGARRMSDFRVILNVAMGGNVCGGQLPRDGVYDYVIHELKMLEEPIGGWGQFGVEFDRTREGKTM